MPPEDLARSLLARFYAQETGVLALRANPDPETGADLESLVAAAEELLAEGLVARVHVLRRGPEGAGTIQLVMLYGFTVRGRRIHGRPRADDHEA